MKMAIKEWNIKLGNEKYKIDLDHGYFSGKRIIYINNRKVLDDKRLLDIGDLYAFNINEHECIISIKVGNLLPTFTYDLIVDGVSHEKGKKSKIVGKIREENESWSKVREKGKLRYAIVDGGLKQGLIIGIIASSIGLLGKSDFNLLGILEQDFISEVIFGCIAWTIVGCIEALLMWKHKEKKFQKPYKQINL